MRLVARSDCAALNSWVNASFVHKTHDSHDRRGLPPEEALV